jgi:methylated-DNA-[protein]-cysteine S-methyltransferase
MRDIEQVLKRSAADLPGAPPADLDARLADRAGEEGVLDVAYGFADTPVGQLTVAATPRGLVRIAYPLLPPEAVVAELATRVSPRILEAPARVDEVRRELDEYFEGRRTSFELPIDWTLSRGFVRRVLRNTARIGYGEVSTYTEMATKSGSPRAVRAAGNALGSNPIPIVVPCHRVLRLGGALGGYGGGPDRKEYLLRLEGVLAD